MKRWAQLWFSIAVLAHAAHAAEVELEIAPPEPEWLLPPMSQACPLLGGGRIEACTTQLLPEGIVEVGEEGLALELAPLIAVGDHEAILARAKLNYGADLELLEAGDIEGFLATRRPTDGFKRTGPLVPPGSQFARARSSVNNPRNDLGLGDESPRPAGTATGNAVIPTREPSLPDFISASILYVIGHSYFSLERYVPAETAFKLALTALPNHIRAHESLGMLYLRTERYADARVHLTRAAQLGRNTAHIHAALGYLEQKSRHYWAAANAFQKALALEPANRTALRGLLHALTETGEHAKAKVLVEQLLRDAPDDPDLWRYRAQIALAANDRATALASLETALRLGDDSVANRETCIALHMESGNIARAVELLRGSSAPAFPLVDQALGWLANENEWDDFRELSTSVDRSALSGVEQSRLLTRRASLALRDGNRRAASTGLQEALALDPSNADALMALGQIYRAERDYARAELLLRRASDYGAVREGAMVARAQLAIEQENFDGAIAHLRNAVVLNPARADLRRNIDVLENLVVLRTQR